VPLVPLHGSVGSSGDLCPLAHLFAVLVGEGPYYLVREPADLAPGWRELRDPGRHLAADLGLEAPAPSFKEGLALINGATFSAAILALAVVDAEALAGAADVAAALSLEAACGCARAFDPKIHAARNQEGQAASAATLRALLAGSRLVDSAGAVQDPYSLRCAPAVHGASRDAIAYARRVAEREANAATDNPLFFPGEAGEAHSEPAWDLGFRANWPADYRGSERASYSACNFHGQPLALAADFLAIALAELADISERRTQLLLDAKVSRNLPANLVARRGVNSGLMVAQYTAAGLVSENKVLAHPASVDSIPTAAGAEDHNAMATIAARKARTVAAHCEAVLAIELMVAAQAVDWRAGVGRPPRPMAPAGRGPWPGTVPSPEAGAAAGEAEAFRAATAAERREAIAGHLGRGTAAAYRAIRRVVAPLAEDRPVAPDLLALRRLLAAGTLLAAVEAALGRSLL
jgi:histidine ammonia-lyase